MRLVLESDGTQVEDGDYWRTLPPNTVLLLLRAGERWYPTGVDVIKAGECTTHRCYFYCIEIATRVQLTHYVILQRYRQSQR